jgi:hypothetical protein
MEAHYAIIQADRGLYMINMISIDIISPGRYTEETSGKEKTSLKPVFFK